MCIHNIPKILPSMFPGHPDSRAAGGPQPALVVGRDGEAMVVDSGCTVLFAASDASDEKAMVCATPMAPTPRTPMAPTRLTEGARRRKKETILWASRRSSSHVLYSCTAVVHTPRNRI